MFHISLELEKRREKRSVPLTDKCKLEDGLGKEHRRIHFDIWQN